MPAPTETRAFRERLLRQTRCHPMAAEQRSKPGSFVGLHPALCPNPSPSEYPTSSHSVGQCVQGAYRPRIAK